MKTLLGPGDGQRIWRNFKRFAEYDDLKDLYQKVLPSIQDFEQKIFNYGQENEMNKQIILKFDEHLARKADKMHIDKIYEHCATTYTKSEN